MDANASHDPASVPAVQELDRASQSLVIDARGLRITTPETYTFAGQKLTEIKGRRKTLDELRKSMTAPLDAAKKAVMDFFRVPAERLDQAENAIKREMVLYANEQERIRREQQAKLEEAARKERERLARQQAEAEAKSRAERARLRQEAEEAAAAGRAAEAAKLAAKAERVEEKAAAKAEALQALEAAVVAPIAVSAAPRVAGTSFRDTWYAECTDLKALAKAVVEGRAPLSYLQANDKTLGQQARSLKADFACDGVRVWCEKTIAAGAA